MDLAEGKARWVELADTPERAARNKRMWVYLFQTKVYGSELRRAHAGVVGLVVRDERDAVHQPAPVLSQPSVIVRGRDRVQRAAVVPCARRQSIETTIARDRNRGSAT